MNFVIIGIVIVLFFGSTAVALWGILGGRGSFMGKRREAVRAIATELGLSYRDGSESLKLAYEEKGVSPGTLEKLPAFIRKLMESAAPWRIEGEYEGVRVSIYEETRSSGKSSVTYTIMKAWYRVPLAFKFKAAHEGFFTKLGKAVFGLKDVQVGDEAFDREVRIAADDEMAAAALFYGSEARSNLLALLGTYPEAKADGRFVGRERAGRLASSDEIRKTLSLLVPVARSLGG